MVEEKFAVRVENVEHKICDWDVPHKFFAHLFPAKTLLESAERQSSADGVPGDDLAIENRLGRQTRQSRRQFREGHGNFIASTRKYPDHASADVGLSADAIVFIFYRNRDRS